MGERGFERVGSRKVSIEMKTRELEKRKCWNRWES